MHAHSDTVGKRDNSFHEFVRETYTRKMKFKIKQTGHTARFVLNGTLRPRDLHGHVDKD